MALLEATTREPNVLVFWVYAAVSGYAGWRAARRSWWRGVPVLALISMSFIAAWEEWRDPVLGAALASKGGRFYPYHFIISGALAYGVTVLGMVRSRRAASRMSMTHSGRGSSS
jgi:hypothetical protein